jgi:hypothetical protein
LIEKHLLRYWREAKVNKWNRKPIVTYTICSTLSEKLLDDFAGLIVDLDADVAAEIMLMSAYVANFTHRPLGKEFKLADFLFTQ